MNGNEYEDVWMETYTGGKVHFTNPRPEEINITDIAHQLSMLCRFTGACREFYSVAEHCIRVAHIVPINLKLAALLHDAAEAYTNDISRPVKHAHKLDEMETILTFAIDNKYKIDSRHPEIREADNILLATEARDLMANTDGWAKLPPPLDESIVPMYQSGEAEAVFIAKFFEYGGKE